MGKGKRRWVLRRPRDNLGFALSGAFLYGFYGFYSGFYGLYSGVFIGFLVAFLVMVFILGLTIQGLLKRPTNWSILGLAQRKTTVCFFFGGGGLLKQIPKQNRNLRTYHEQRSKNTIENPC